MEGLKHTENAVPESISMPHLMKATDWLQSMVAGIGRSISSIGTGGEYSSYEKKHLPNRHSFNLPSFTWIENICEKAKSLEPIRRQSTDSDFSRYFDMAMDKHTGNEDDHVAEAQPSTKSVPLEFDTEWTTESNKSSEGKGRSLSDSALTAKNKIKNTFVRVRSSLDHSKHHSVTNKADDVLECSNNEDKIDASEDTKTPQQGTLNLSLQHFPSTSQIRLLLLKGEDIQSSSGRLIVRASLLGCGEVQTLVSRNAEVFSRKALFNDNLYFNAESIHLDDYTLKLQLLKKRRFFRRPKTIGEVSIKLGDLHLDFDTNVTAPLYRQQGTEKSIEVTDLQILTNKSIEEDVMANLEITETMELRSTMKRVRSLPIIGRSRVVLKSSTPVTTHLSFRENDRRR